MSTKQTNDPGYVASTVIKAVTLANLVVRRLKGASPKEASAEIKKIVDNGDIVFGVWSDANSESGFGWLVIKGQNLLRNVITEQKLKVAVITAIPCTCMEQAEAARRAWGDKTH